MRSEPPVAGLSNFIARPGLATPSPAAPQRGSVQPGPSSSPAPAKGQGIRALTLRVDDELYRRLRRFAFDRELTHQEILEEALRAHLSAHGG